MALTLGALVLASPAVSAADTGGPAWDIRTSGGFLLSLDAGLGIGAGLDADRRFASRHLAIGLALEGVIGALNSEGDCYYGGRCMYGYTSLGPFVEGHALPDFVLDPWLRATLAPALLGGSDQRDAPTVVGLMGDARVGLDVRIWRFALGPWGRIAGFSTRNTTSVGAGVRLGFEI